MLAAEEEFKGTEDDGVAVLLIAGVARTELLCGSLTMLNVAQSKSSLLPAREKAILWETNIYLLDNGKRRDPHVSLEPLLGEHRIVMMNVA